MASRGWPRITEKAGEKTEQKNTLERYAGTEKEKAKREGDTEAWEERMLRVERGMEMLEELVEVIRRERKKERERWEKEREEERNRWRKERKEERKRWEKERDNEREAWKREKEAERERWEREWERWRGEKKELESRIRGIEEERDMAERERRRRNVVIRGADWGEESNEGAVA
jgi:chromosome segregation ATPase